MLTTVTYYRLPRDEDGNPNHLYDRLFVMALRWWVDIDIPNDMISSASKKRGEAPGHKGEVALRQLQEGGEISQRQLDAAFVYLRDALAFYENDPWHGIEPYPGRNAEAAHDLRELLAAMTGSEAEQL